MARSPIIFNFRFCTLLGLTAIVAIGFPFEQAEDEPVFFIRHAKAFPYSNPASYLRMLKPISSPSLSRYAPMKASMDTRRLIDARIGAMNELAEIINMIDTERISVEEHADRQPEHRERRGVPQLKRYACRFKFCRIFDQ